MKNILIKIDSFIRGYLGINETETTPQVVKKCGKNLFLLNRESFKRHIVEIPISNINLSEMNDANKKKIGIAIGKSIAKNLTISFDAISIKKGNINA